MPYDYLCKSPATHGTTSHCPACQTAGSDTIIRARWGGASEPQIIYDLFFSSNAFTNWATYLKAWQPALLYAGVFIHQRPYCQFNKHGTPAIAKACSHPCSCASCNPACRCELGDLLVVFTDHPAQRRVAAVFQAKMAGGPWPPTNPNPDQWELYTHWPTLRYTPRRPPPPPGSQPPATPLTPGPQIRTLPFAGSNDPAAQYLELDPSPPSVETTQSWSPASWSAWDGTINRILNGSAGRDFSWSRALAANDWDELIWDLLDYTQNCAMPGSVSAGSSGTRGVGSLLELRTVLDATRGHGPGDTPLPGLEDGDWGLPIIHIIRENS